MKAFKVQSIEIKQAQSHYPDIDVDLGAHPATGISKDDVILYLKKKYGNDYVCNIGVRMTYAPKSLLRDLGSVYKIPASEIFEITKIYDDGESVSYMDNLVNNKKIREFNKKYAEYEFNKKVDTLSGVVSAYGTHAGGVLISDKYRGFDINNFCALQRNKEDEQTLSTLWTKDEIEQLGFIKYDLLGLTSAGMIHYAKELVGMDPYGEIEEDIAVFKSLVPELKNKNIFQFESDLGKKMWSELKPMSIMDLAAVSGLVRTLVNESGRSLYEQYKINVAKYQNGDTEFWKNRIYENCKEKRIADAVIKCTAESYGIFVFQEQLSNFVNEISNGERTFTDGNVFRKKMDYHSHNYGAIDKHQGNEEALRIWYDSFMAPMQDYIFPYLGKDGVKYATGNTKAFLDFDIKDKRLVTPDEGIIKWIMSAAAYLFNKSHAVCYSVNSYEMMYLKHYHPLEFWLSSLMAVSSSLDKAIGFINAMRTESGIKILPPDINKSNANFSIEDKSIRYGLETIKGFGSIANAIVNERNENGLYKNIDDFLSRMKGTRLTKRHIHTLLCVNAFSEFGTMKDLFREIVLFGKDIDDLIDEKDLAAYESEMCGINISYSNPILDKLDMYCAVPDLISGVSDVCAVKINKVTKKISKNNKEYNHVNLTCLNSHGNYNAFDWQNNEDLVVGSYMALRLTKNGNFITVNGKHRFGKK